MECFGIYCKVADQEFVNLSKYILSGLSPILSYPIYDTIKINLKYFDQIKRKCVFYY